MCRVSAIASVHSVYRGFPDTEDLIRFSEHSKTQYSEPLNPKPELTEDDDQLCRPLYRTGVRATSVSSAWSFVGSHGIRVGCRVWDRLKV